MKGFCVFVLLLALIQVLVAAPIEPTQVDQAPVISEIEQGQAEVELTERPVDATATITTTLEKLDSFKTKVGCAICNDPDVSLQYASPHRFNCAHASKFHDECIKEWIEMCETNGDDVTCPVCRDILPDPERAERIAQRLGMRIAPPGTQSMARVDEDDERMDDGCCYYSCGTIVGICCLFMCGAY